MNWHPLRWARQSQLALVMLVILALNLQALTARYSLNLGSAELIPVALASTSARSERTTSQLARAGYWLQLALAWQPDQARAHARLGMANRLAGEGERAAYHLSLAAQLEAGNPFIHFELGDLLDTTGKREEAILEWRKAGAAPYFMAKAAKAESLSDAIEMMHLAVSIAPDWAEAHLQLAQALQRQGRDTEAQAEYATAAELFPADSAWAYLAQGHVLAYSKEWNQAIAVHRQAIDRAGEDREVISAAMRAIGDVLHTGLQRRDDAIRQYEAWAEFAGDAAAFIEIGNVWLNERDFVEARRWYQLAKETSTAYSGEAALRILQSYGAEGQYARNAGDCVRSEQACQEVIRLVPDQPGGYYCLALTEAWCKRDYERGIELMRQAAQAAPNEPLFYAYLGRLWREKGDLDQAEVYARISLEKGPSNSTAHAEMAQLWMARGRPREAIAELEQAIALGPQAWYYVVLGDAYRQIGDRVAAEQSYEQALVLAPGWQDVQQKLRTLAEEK